MTEWSGCHAHVRTPCGGQAETRLHLKWLPCLPFSPVLSCISPSLTGSSWELYHLPTIPNSCSAPRDPDLRHRLSGVFTLLFTASRPFHVGPFYWLLHLPNHTVANHFSKWRRTSSLVALRFCAEPTPSILHKAPQLVKLIGLKSEACPAFPKIAEQ